MGSDPIRAQHERLNEMMALLNCDGPRRCLYSTRCTAEVINAHSISRAILGTIQDDGQVIRPGAHREKDDEGSPSLQLSFDSVGISNASTGYFICQQHDRIFSKIDTTPMDFDNPGICDLLLYRAVLREIWRLMVLGPLTAKIDQVVPGAQLPSVHPNTRLRTLLYIQEVLMPSIASGGATRDDSSVVHMVRQIKSEQPILASSSASGGSILALNQAGKKIPDRYLGSHLGIEPYGCWGLTIIPQETEHVVLVSWLQGSQAERYFNHIREVQGRELEAAISAELILFSENWFLRPAIWEGYGQKKQEAIVVAYNNFEQMLSGGYNWLDKPTNTPWYEYLEVPNRHQINLFSYNPSALS